MLKRLPILAMMALLANLLVAVPGQPIHAQEANICPPGTSYVGLAPNALHGGPFSLPAAIARALGSTVNCQVQAGSPLALHQGPGYRLAYPTAWQPITDANPVDGALPDSGTWLASIGGVAAQFTSDGPPLILPPGEYVLFVGPLVPLEGMPADALLSTLAAQLEADGAQVIDQRPSPAGPQLLLTINRGGIETAVTYVLADVGGRLFMVYGMSAPADANRVAEMVAEVAETLHAG